MVAGLPSSHTHFKHTVSPKFHLFTTQTSYNVNVSLERDVTEGKYGSLNNFGYDYTATLQYHKNGKWNDIQSRSGMFGYTLPKHFAFTNIPIRLASTRVKIRVRPATYAGWVWDIHGKNTTVYSKSFSR